MARAKFNQTDFLAAALAIAAERGPPGVTVAAVTERLRAPTGSFYHRFTSRDALLGALWLQTVLDFQQGLSAALDAGDGLAAALHTPFWVRAHPDEARLLLLYDRTDFIVGEWPQELRERVADMAEKMESGASRRAQIVCGCDGPEERRIAQFLIAEVPVAAVRQHLVRREPPPPQIEWMIESTYKAVISAYHTRHRPLT